MTDLTFILFPDRQARQIRWCVENNIKHKIKEVRTKGNNDDRTSFWDIIMPAIEFFNEEDFIAFKLRWS